MLEFFNPEEDDARFVVELAYKHGHHSFKGTECMSPEVAVGRGAGTLYNHSQKSNSATNPQELLQASPNSAPCPKSSRLNLDQLSTIDDEPPPVPPKGFPPEILSYASAEVQGDHFQDWDPNINTIFEDLDVPDSSLIELEEFQYCSMDLDTPF
jgi:hypothetical protein